MHAASRRFRELPSITGAHCTYAFVQGHHAIYVTESCGGCVGRAGYP